MDGKEEFNRKSYYSNRWFWISVGITILLIALLVWNLINSYSTIKRFEKKEFKLQKASSELLYHITSMEMSTRLAVATGDLRLKRRYREHRPKLNNLLGKINSLVED